ARPSSVSTGEAPTTRSLWWRRSIGSHAATIRFWRTATPDRGRIVTHSARRLAAGSDPLHIRRRDLAPSRPGGGAAGVRPFTFAAGRKGRGADAARVGGAPESGSSGGANERGFEVGDEVVDGLDADGQADEVRRRGERRVRRRGVRHRRRDLDQALDAAEALGE